MSTGVPKAINGQGHLWMILQLFQHHTTNGLIAWQFGLLQCLEAEIEMLAKVLKSSNIRGLHFQSKKVTLS